MSYYDIPGRYAMSWILRDALASTRPNGIWVEVGVALGRGIAQMARTLIDAGRDDVTLYAVDPWAGTERNGEQQAEARDPRHGDWALFVDTMQTHAPEELRRIHVLRCSSVEASKILRHQHPDLVILDGDHRKDAVAADIRAWYPHIRTGGVIGGDDYNTHESPGVPAALLDAFGEGGFEVGNEGNWPTWRKVAE